MRKIFIIVVAVILVLPSFLVPSSASDDDEEQVSVANEGTVSSKDEVVYATLSPTGERKEIYVVNTLDVITEGLVNDYGSYTSLKNLTDLSEIEYANDEVSLTAPAGKFYYQGNMDDTALPWDIAVSYFLDGKEISPAELAGKDGHVEIKITTAANQHVDATFFENYMLQISLALDSSIYSNIKAVDGMIANAGKDKQVTFTVMPEQEVELVVSADVVNFELNGIDIAGVPFSMSFDTPDIDGMTDDMYSLTDAIKEINDGVGKLSEGVSELNNGVSDFRDGSEQYKNGITALDGASAELVSGSQEIEDALDLMSRSLGNSGDMELSGMNDLINGLSGIAGGLRETVDGLTNLKGHYQEAYGALDGAITTINHDVTPEEIAALQNSNADPQVIGKLLETYTAAQTVKGTYDMTKQAFDAVDMTLDQTIGGLTEMATHLEIMADELTHSLAALDDDDGFAQLQEGLATLATNYQTFHAGLTEYTEGLGQLAGSYEDLHNGIVSLSEGTGELEDGVGELHNGTTELHESTQDLPEQMTDEIDQMIDEYASSDFDVVSFVSDKNENVNSVQFVLRTGSIKYEEPVESEEVEDEEKGFWTRFKELFS